MKLEELNLTLKTSIAGIKEHVLVYRDDRAGVQMEIHTPVKKGHHYSDPDRFGKARRVFSIDGIDGEFNHEEFIKVLEPITIPQGTEENK